MRGSLHTAMRGTKHYHKFHIMEQVLALLVFWGLVGIASPQFSPYLFVCNYHGGLNQGDLSQGEIALSVTIEGSPAYYVPGHMYQVSISTSSDFNGLLITGLYSSTTFDSQPNPAMSLLLGGNSPGVPAWNTQGSNHMCSIVHQHMGITPQKSSEFYWIAPPDGSGCVNFLATASLQHNVLFKDALALQLCEMGMPTQAPYRPQLAMVHSEGVILRDDFDSSTDLDYTIWSEVYGGNISTTCGTVLHGNSMVFCQHVGNRELTTVHLNTTTASVLQFALSSGHCRRGPNDYSITVSYAVNDEIDWHIIDRIRVPLDSKTMIHILHLPQEARQEGVCLRFHQDLAMDSHSYTGCWAVDNILIGNAAYRPGTLQENFDPIDPGNWLFFPNGAIKSHCQSNGNALFFRSHHSSVSKHQYVTSHELNLLRLPQEDTLFEEQFTGSSLPPSWEFTGATIGSMCGTLSSGDSVIFNGGDERMACTPFLDTTQAGNVRFYFTMGGGSCDPGDSKDVEVSVIAYVGSSHDPVVLEKFAYNSYRKAQMVSVVIPPMMQSMSTRFCLVQTHHQGVNRNVWAIDEFQLLPWLPHNVTHHAQFTLNLNCGSENIEDNQIDFEFSTNQGKTWSLVAYQCLPGICHGELKPENSSYSSYNVGKGWPRVTVPLPYAALTSNTRFRWKQKNETSTTQWAIDSIYIGDECGYSICSGHGQCSSDGCSCDRGFSGSSCQIPSSPPPTNLTESFQHFDTQQDAKFTTIHGVELGYKCGVLATGKALVFNKDGRRELVTRELNTTDARYLQFTVRLGSHSSVGSCPGPNEPHEGILVMYTCNNGVTWKSLRHLEYDQYHKPRMELIHLPSDASQKSCRFRWFQASHSGGNQDVWALDDITLSDTLYNTIWVDFSDVNDVKKSMSFHMGEVIDACGATDALVFSGHTHNGTERYVETQSITVGPSYMIQFDLVMGCGQPYGDPYRKDKSVYLEYSKDHGLTWYHVHEQCLPGQVGCHGYREASIYDDTKYGAWNRVTLILPTSFSSLSTRFRWRQSVFAPSDTWAIDNIYIGEQCRDMCHGHGVCVNGICRCDSGYVGTTCIPEFPLPSSIQSDFEESGLLQSDWLAVHGGDIIHNGNNACGIITSGASLYFSQAGARELVSHDLNTQLVAFIQFYIHLGGDGTDQTCRNVNARKEGVLLQYSNDGGITWNLLLELYYDDYRHPKFVHQILPDSARTPSTRIRWWQPSHSGANDDQWALDQVYIGSHNNVQTLPFDFQNDDPTGHLWLTLSNGISGSTYCSSGESALVFSGTTGDRFAVTKAMDIRRGDVIQFKIVVGCRSSFTHFSPVHLEFTEDGGMHWEEVMTPCYPSHEGSCQRSSSNYHEGSVYHMGQYAYWKLVVIEVPEKLTRGKVQLRWWQQAIKSAPVFAIDEVYIGPQCPYNCNGHGVCHDGQCVCDYGYQGDVCDPRAETPHGLTDRFDEINPSALWESTIGGNIGQQCGVIQMADSLYFGSIGPREARTMGLNTTSIKLLQFYIRIGSSSLGSQCLQATDLSEAVLVQFSTDNGMVWTTLRVLDPISTLTQDEATKVTIELPPYAKTSETVFRWWQPLSSNSSPRAQWALDNVLIGANDTQSYGFEDHFEPSPSSDSWYMVMGGHAKQFCNSASNTLVFDSEQGMPRYAETWDFHVTMLTFLQFNLVLGCGQTSEIPSAHSVYLEYSTDMGETWKLVAEECVPPDMGCGEYNVETVYGSLTHGSWTRVTVYLSGGTVSESTRFRWIQPAFTSDSDIWAIDDVYLGNGCPWMCSGHGSCVQGQCVCDSGYSEPFCVPSLPLAKELKDTFDQGAKFSTLNWISSYGGVLGNMCGILVSNTAAVFNQPGLKMLTSQDLDCTMMEYIQLTFQYGCPSNTHGNSLSSSRDNSVLLQYSNNGGISWTLLEELYYVSVIPPKFLNIEMPMGAKTNATRFRIWQPSLSGTPWAIDDILIGGNTMNRGWIYDNFSLSSPSGYKWLFHPGGGIGAFCTAGNQVQNHVRLKSNSHILDHNSALVFTESAGARYITTRDINVDEHTVVQFEINIGCADQTVSSDPVKLQYSRDQGSSWSLLLPDCFSSNQSVGICTSHPDVASVYYSGERQGWSRMVIPLVGLHICGTVRFRWYQGFYSHHSNPKSWALDNVYIGFQCPRHCSGHGICLDGMHCRCDEGHGGDWCHPIRGNINFLKEAFEGKRVDSRKFVEWSGAEITDKCDTLITGKSLHFTGTGKRMLVTTSLDLTTASTIQFYIRLGCQHQAPSRQNHPIMLQFSSDGGIHWITMETMAFNGGSNSPFYVPLEIPFRARTNATSVRWWQPSHQGSFLDEWAIDQIFIGGHIYGQSVLQDDFALSLQRDSNNIVSIHEQNWLLSPGSVMQQVCGSGINALYFSGNDIMRYSITADVMVTELTFLQFELAMGCADTQQCYEVDLEYSLDMGKHWQLLYDWCLPSDIDCLSYHSNSKFSSDVYYGWNRIMIPLPAYTRSKATRFRWLQPRGFNPFDTWALSFVYIGSECIGMCGGHGRCNGGLCVCDPGWQGTDCTTSSSQLAHQLRATFNDVSSIETGRWNQLAGGVLSSSCGPVASGDYLFFNGACSRHLITNDLDTTHVSHIQFYFQYGCNSVPTNRDEGVLLQYSTTGGIDWNLLLELFHTDYLTPTFLSVELPTEAKHNGTRIRWWQPKHPGFNQATWAIDNIVIGGSASLPDSLKDDFETGHLRNHWMFSDNTILNDYCETNAAASHLGTNRVTLVGGVNPRENTTITTGDMRLQQDSLIEFKISVGCNSSWDDPINPVHLHYSIDYGVTWDYLVPQCLPGDPQCNGVISPSSVYHLSSGWRRVTIPVPEKLTSRHVRFRWFQQTTERPDVSQRWAIDDVTIGPRCPNMCNGHGICDYPQCSCDEGFSGVSCENSHTDLPTIIKERIPEGQYNESIWNRIQGGRVAMPTDGCGLVHEGWSMYFSGQGLRIAETVDMDLRDSSFVQYHAVIGSDGSSTTCMQATARDDSVILQFSTNGGISWYTVAELDYQQYHAPRQDYITLPRQARTQATRLRWWQPLRQGKQQAQWALDDIYIGGSDINPTLLTDTFDSVFDEMQWEFHPFGSVELQACGNPNGALYWPNVQGSQYRTGSVTTRQLIVDRDYVVQFKISVGCQNPSHTCTTDHAVYLEYNTDPSTDQWTLVQPSCLPSDLFHTRCEPNEYQLGSVFNANQYPTWQRVTFDLPPDATSSSTRLRWVQNSTLGLDSPSWALDDVYVGEKCANMCNGHGICTPGGLCQCDQGFIGDNCTPSVPLSHQLNDNFEGGISSTMWSVVNGGSLGIGCGGLVPHAHGKSLYFSQCGRREAISAEFDTSVASELMFVLKIGSSHLTPSCTVNLTSPNIDNKAILLHYTNDNGIHWHLMQSHDPHDFMHAQRVSYTLPRAARGRAVRFRWWQPEHDGTNKDQWAIDNVHLVMSRRNSMLYPRRMYGKK